MPKTLPLEAFAIDPIDLGMGEPSGYATHRIRDWRWLFLRKRTIKVPYWLPREIVWEPQGIEGESRHA